MPAESVAPVLVGGGQTIDRPNDPADGREPLAMMADAARHAAEDAGGGSALLAAIDTVAVVNTISWDYGDAPGLLAERLGCPGARGIYTTMGGNTPQSLLNHLCDEVAAGRSQVALLCGAETFQTVRAFGKAGRRPEWTPARPARSPAWGDSRPGMSNLELRHGITQPIVAYPMVENAFRAARGLSLAAHQRELADWCARTAAVAVSNPYAWFRDGKSAGAIGTVTAENRMVGFPYPKFMNSILDVNQGAAVLVCAESAARRLGIPTDRWIWPWAGVDVTEHWFLQDRVDYHTLPGVRRAGTALLETVGVTVEGIAHLDLYSCFPIAPRLSAAMLGLAPDAPRPFTVTGGLPWFGGPGSNYATHAVATLIARLRADRASLGLAHALGWNLTKHALAVYGGTPPPRGWRRVGGPSLQEQVDAEPHPAVVEQAAGPGTIEAYTVMHDRDGAPERGSVIGRLPDGRRFLAVLPRDRTLLEAMERAEQVARAGTVRQEGERNVFDPA